MNWFRWYHGTATDPKLAYVAHISQQPLPLVIAVWVMLLETASQSNPRGSITSFDADCAAVTLVTVTLHIEQIIAAMTQKEMVIDGRIGKWGMRQCDPTAAERMRNYRERLKLQNDPVTPVTVTLRSVTDVTPEEKRIKNKPIVQNEHFEKFWDAFNYKKGKAPAERAWDKIPRLDEELINKIIIAANNESLQRPNILARGRTPKMAEGWLNDRRWEDVIDFTNNGFQQPPIQRYN